MSAENNAVVAQVEEPTTAIAPINADPLAFLRDQLRVVWCNAPTGSDEMMSLFEASIGKPTLQKEKAYNRPLSLVAALVQAVTGADKDTGEVYDGYRTTILLDTGETMRFGSSGILQSIAVLTMGRLPGLWVPPLEVTLEAVDVGMAGPKLTLKRVPKQLPAPNGKGGKRG